MLMKLIKNIKILIKKIIFHEIRIKLIIFQKLLMILVNKINL